MLKKDKNFRFPKENKRVLASMSRKDASAYKKLIIDAMIQGSIEPPKEKKKGKRKVKSETDED
jgi:hypothetical protein